MRPIVWENSRGRTTRVQPRFNFIKDLLSPQTPRTKGEPPLDSTAHPPYIVLQAATTGVTLDADFKVGGVRIMKKQFSKQRVVVGVLGMMITAAVFALGITYLAYLPTITSVPLQKSDVWLGQEFYRIACNSFFISGASGLVLGFALPVIVRAFKYRFGKHAASVAS